MLRIVTSFCLRNLTLNMPESKATSYYQTMNYMREIDDMFNDLREWILELDTFAKKCKTANIELFKKKINEDNRKLDGMIDYAKKELIQLQIARGVTQIPVPEDSADVKDQSLKSSAELEDRPDTVLSSENASNESKPARAPRPKKQLTTPAVEEPRIDVGRLDIRVGKVIHAQVHPDADQLYIEQIDVGEEISRTVVSGLVRHIPLAELDQHMVVVLCNLKPQKMRGIVSEAMVLCASTPETVELLTPPPEARPGDNITVPGYSRNPDLPFMNPKKKIWEKVSEDLKVNSKKQASYKDVPWEIEGKSGHVTVQALSGCYIK